MHKLSYDRNMVQFYGACLDPACPMLVLEYMEGGDLQSCILQDSYPDSIGKFRWYKKGARLALDVAKGLVFLHEQKVGYFSLEWWIMEELSQCVHACKNESVCESQRESEWVSE